MDVPEEFRTFTTSGALCYRGAVPAPTEKHLEFATRGPSSYPGCFEHDTFHLSAEASEITRKLLAVGSTRSHRDHVYCAIPSDWGSPGVGAVIAAPLVNGGRIVLFLERKNSIAEVVDTAEGPEHILESSRRGRSYVMEQAIATRNAGPKSQPPANPFFDEWEAKKREAERNGFGKTLDFFVLVTVNPLDGTIATGSIEAALAMARATASSRKTVAEAAVGLLASPQHPDEGFIDVRHLQQVVPMLGHALFASQHLNLVGGMNARASP